MPRGIPKAKALSLQFKRAELDVLVPKGAVNFPATETPIPKGVTIRSSTGVQIEFMYKGARQYETIRGKPTVGHVQAAVEKRERVMQLIGLGSFNYEVEFPDSSSARVKREEKETDDATKIKNIDTVGSALDAWLVISKSSVGINAGEDYEKDIKRLKQFPSSVLLPVDAGDRNRSGGFLGDVAANELTDIGITCLQNWLFSQPGAKAGTTLSEKRVRNLMTPIRGAMERLAEAGAIQRNPFNSVKPIKTKKSVYKKGTSAGVDELDVPLPILNGVRYLENDVEVEPFSPNEVAQILGNLSGSFLNQMVFWFWTGLRTGELIALRWSDIDWDGNHIYIQRSLSRGHLKLPKFDKKRWVKLSQPARKALEEQRKLAGDDAGFVFTNPHTKKMWANESKICSRFKKAVELAGVTYRRPYNCRHTYASVMLSSGENPLYVAEQMGHADWSMLIKVYGRWMKGVDLLAGQRVATMHEAHWQSLTALLENRQNVGEDIGTEVEPADEGEQEDEELEF
jgi:integrase